MNSAPEQMVEISIERLRRLEQLEASIPQLVEAAIKQYKQEKLKSLHEKDKQNPTAANMRARRYAEKHRDEINARRREKRRMAKETVAEPIGPVGPIGPKPAATPAKTERDAPISKSNTRKSQKSIAPLSAPQTPPLLPLEITDSGITVRFDM